jgi:hypothetical protein
MKLVLLIILLCGITSTPNYTSQNKETYVAHQKTTSNPDMVPFCLLFQF